MTQEEIKERLAYLKSLIIDERISYGEIAELQSLAKYIDPSDTQLLEWAGVPEGTNPEGTQKELEIPLSLEDILELQEGVDHNWEFEGVKVHLFNEDYSEE